MTQELLLKAVEQLLLAGIVGMFGLCARQLQKIAQELASLKVDLAVIVTKVHDHDRRLEKLEIPRPVKR